MKRESVHTRDCGLPAIETCRAGITPFCVPRDMGVGVYTGVRFGEITALQVQHVDLLRKRLLIRRAFTEIAGELKAVPPKSGQPRDIPLPKRLHEPLRQHHRRQGWGP